MVYEAATSGSVQQMKTHWTFIKYTAKIQKEQGFFFHSALVKMKFNQKSETELENN